MSAAADREALAKVLMMSKALARKQIEVAVNMCPDDDPPGEHPMKTVWAEDIGAVAEYIIAALPSLGWVKADHRATRYEQCVTDADGNCTRWTHDHAAPGTTKEPTP